jgi:hypothetical protein
LTHLLTDRASRLISRLMMLSIIITLFITRDSITQTTSLSRSLEEETSMFLTTLTSPSHTK